MFWKMFCIVDLLDEDSRMHVIVRSIQINLKPARFLMRCPSTIGATNDHSFTEPYTCGIVVISVCMVPV